MLLKPEGRQHGMEVVMDAIPKLLSCPGCFQAVLFGGSPLFFFFFFLFFLSFLFFLFRGGERFLPGDTFNQSWWKLMLSCALLSAEGK